MPNTALSGKGHESVGAVPLSVATRCWTARCCIQNSACANLTACPTAGLGEEAGMPSDGREATTNSRFGALETPPVAELPTHVALRPGQAELPKTRRASTVDLEARSTVVRSSASQPFNTACPTGRAKCCGDRRSVAEVTAEATRQRKKRRRKARVAPPGRRGSGTERIWRVRRPPEVALDAPTFPLEWAPRPPRPVRDHANRLANRSCFTYALAGISGRAHSRALPNPSVRQRR